MDANLHQHPAMVQQQPPATYYQDPALVEKSAANQAFIPPPQQHLDAASYTAYERSNASAAPGPGTTILNIKRSIALAVLAVIAILLIIVIGLAAGLGVSQRNYHQAQDKLAQDERAALLAATQNPTALTASTVYITTTTTATPASATGPTGTSSSASASSTVKSTIICPATNGTSYTSSKDSGAKKFTRLCGIDYSGTGASDLDSKKATTMDACIDLCAAKKDCTGAGWGFISGDSGNSHSCFMKTNLTKSHKATSDWGFGLLVQGVITDDAE
ncbi:hypothetical protein B0T17DRAFT_525065 [Bombardia bombarda]|uniref:Apple domain-containing protein n=1 Tax=Bombardia bombarda TaxID=252184 RepID=A0AA39X8Q9_9PEZI|nr:hypothetical protein B0T17DRAFT_525065 [Bombardia bombarda]